MSLLFKHSFVINPEPKSNMMDSLFSRPTFECCYCGITVQQQQHLNHTLSIYWAASHPKIKPISGCVDKIVDPSHLAKSVSHFDL